MPVDSVQSQLSQIRTLVAGARSMPMSASCVVNRNELLALVDDLAAQLPEAMTQARSVLQDRDDVVAEGRREAAEIVQQAHDERQQMLSEHEVYAQAAAEATRLLEEAQAGTDIMRTEVDDYVDGKLANFEIVLHKTLRAVERGRQKLAGRNDLDDLGDRFEEEGSFPS